MEEYYKEDLAFIHDVGFNDYALKSAPGILAILAQHNIREGLVVDLGCGSGLSAQEFTKAGYDVLGIDISESMIAMSRDKPLLYETLRERVYARARVPTAEFRIASLFEAEIPPCNAVTSIGECLNYQFDAKSDRQSLINLFHRIYNALNPGGVFIFDIAEPGQVTQGITKGFTEGEDWIVLVEKQENQQQNILTRRIITFRKVGEHYRRDDEIHYQQLYTAEDIASELSRVGFQVQTMRNYGQYPLPKAHVAFVAHKFS
ncbi:class I SAM-dependent methyltransferase [Tolypothrix sp. PCC 7910]|uniref:class I SAM-dependent DNA methyltransferase n=1 Tax=Tolypothrix sp. PCC 7910 TaxID=2099387 RepID=UPI001427704E|nr:class I SAM-dependent methyltransferase [Tolypothrix sp. PCC 7910]QIR37720.1 class I SAM-dependent methyltransferase [Tolypothrix sp. PCC 7910]